MRGWQIIFLMMICLVGGILIGNKQSELLKAEVSSSKIKYTDIAVENKTLQSENEYLNATYFSEYNLYREIVQDSILFPDVVYAQAVIESGAFKSNLFFKHNNLFGFNNGQMVFKNWRECVHFYKRWQDRFYHGSKTEERQYLKFIEDIGYAEDTNYIKKVKGAM